MLFWGPFTMFLDGAHRRAAHLAGVDSPLCPITVTGKNFLQVIAKLAVARL